MMKVIRCFWPLFVAVGLIYLFGNAWGTIPPMGKLLSPFQGYLQNAETAVPSGKMELAVGGLKEAVTIWYDDNAVPHVFAQNDEDMYFAQGYVVARDRLWQMEFYTLVAAGRLTEIVGDAALAFDRNNRRMGMARSAAIIAEKLKTDTLSSKIATAYAAGVNAYIDQLRYRSLPIEYKLLNYSPEHWSPEKTILMLMNMRNTLNGGSNDDRLTNVLATYGPNVIADLFPDYPGVESPVIPVGTPWAFTPLTTPSVPDTTWTVPGGDQRMAMEIATPRPEVGSNNWAVHGSRTATGLPLLANDPHLQLTLPSIWYQMQLSAPGVNVYGVALPGTPAIIIGFTKDIAWGVTNVGSDVMDFYRIRFRDSTRREYWHDDSWKPVVFHTETFSIKGGAVVRDTVLYTHHGPVVNQGSEASIDNIPAGYAMRWITNETDGSDMLTFHYLNRAKDYDDYRQALTYFVAPAQHFIFSSNGNDIAITSNGRLPLKWEGQGKYLLDGTLASHDWQGWIPASQNPTVKNPPAGFLSSANQFPTDTTYPYYLDWKFAHSSRALRINERLAAMSGANADSLRRLQNDNFNVDARRILPTLIPVLASVDSIRELSEFTVLSKWNYRNDAKEIGASIFEYWIPELRRAMWDDEFPMDGRMLYPSLDRTFSLIENDPTASWFDNTHTTASIESMSDIAAQSFMAALRKLREQFGPLSSNDWAWANVKHTRIMHLVPAFTSFGRSGIQTGGGGEVINATTATHGPSWRMVVQLDRDWPTAYGLYPGGQSGNPGSPFYDNMIDRWASGKLDTLLFIKDLQSIPERIMYQISLKPNPR